MSKKSRAERARSRDQAPAPAPDRSVAQRAIDNVSRNAKKIQAGLDHRGGGMPWQLTYENPEPVQQDIRVLRDALEGGQHWGDVAQLHSMAEAQRAEAAAVESMLEPLNRSMSSTETPHEMRRFLRDTEQPMRTIDASERVRDLTSRADRRSMGPDPDRALRSYGFLEADRISQVPVGSPVRDLATGGLLGYTDDSAFQPAYQEDEYPTLNSADHEVVRHVRHLLDSPDASVGGEPTWALLRHARDLVAPLMARSPQLRRNLEDITQAIDRGLAEEALDALPPPPGDLSAHRWSAAVDSRATGASALNHPAGIDMARVLVDDPDKASPETYLAARAWAGDTAREVTAADPCFVGRDVCEVVASAMSGWPLDAPIPVENAPAGRLWVHFERPIPLGTWPNPGMGLAPGDFHLAAAYLCRDASGLDAGALRVVFFSDLPGMVTRLVPICVERIEPGHRILDLRQRSRESNPHLPDDQLADANERGNRVNMALAALLAFLGQRLAVQSAGPLAREVRRRLEREHQTPPRRVRVIALRRRAARPSTGDSTPVDWSCRWWVGARDGGVWRTLHRGQPTQRTIWIAPFLKGPADKPLKPVDGRLFAVVR